jgi:hypothetical protein
MKIREILAENSHDEYSEDIHNGSYVTDTQDSSGEVFRVSQYEPGTRRCWIGDNHGRGWYIHPSRLVLCTDQAKINQYFGHDQDDELAELDESASGGATSAGAVASVASPLGAKINRRPSLFGYVPEADEDPDSQDHTPPTKIAFAVRKRS